MLASKIVLLGSYASLIIRDEQACMTPTSTASQVSVQAANNPSIKRRLSGHRDFLDKDFRAPGACTLREYEVFNAVI